MFLRNTFQSKTFVSYPSGEPIQPHPCKNGQFWVRFENFRHFWSNDFIKYQLSPRRVISPIPNVSREHFSVQNICLLPIWWTNTAASMRKWAILGPGGGRVTKSWSATWWQGLWPGGLFLWLNVYDDIDGQALKSDNCTYLWFAKDICIWVEISHFGAWRWRG